MNSFADRIEVGSLRQLEVEKIRFTLNRADFLQLAGAEDEATASLMHSLLEKLEPEILARLSPKGTYVFLPASRPDGEEELVQVANAIFKPGKTVGRLLRNSEFAALFICTIGCGLEKMARQRMEEGELLEAYVIDMAGSVLTEQLAAELHRTVSAYCDQFQYRVTNTYSPGYCDWNVEEQFRLFHFFDTEDTGVQLTDGALMEPVKSLSGIIGIGRNVTLNTQTCLICNDKTCLYRLRKSDNY